MGARRRRPGAGHDGRKPAGQAARKHELAKQVVRDEGFDQDNSMFGGGFEIGELLSGIMNGMLTSRGAWRRMGRGQRWRCETFVKPARA